MESKIIGMDILNERDMIFTFESPGIASTASPGQFVEVKVSTGLDPFLRRPFSIYSTDGNRLKLLIRIVGRGTKLMSSWRPGDTVDILGPFGNGYEWEEREREFLLAGGGIGYAPIHFLMEKLRAEKRQVHFLFSPGRESELIADLDVGKLASVTVAKDRTEIAPLLDKILSENPGLSKVFSCGPDGMMKIVAESAKKHNIPSRLSMEAFMGCGFGICVGCVIPILEKDDVVYKKVCVDGPVFSGEEVCFDEQPKG